MNRESLFVDERLKFHMYRTDGDGYLEAEFMPTGTRAAARPGGKQLALDRLRVRVIVSALRNPGGLFAPLSPHLSAFSERLRAEGVPLARRVLDTGNEDERLMSMVFLAQRGELGTPAPGLEPAARIDSLERRLYDGEIEQLLDPSLDLVIR